MTAGATRIMTVWTMNMFLLSSSLMERARVTYPTNSTDSVVSLVYVNDRCHSRVSPLGVLTENRKIHDPPKPCAMSKKLIQIDHHGQTEENGENNGSSKGRNIVVSAFDSVFGECLPSRQDGGSGDQIHSMSKSVLKHSGGGTHDCWFATAQMKAVQGAKEVLFG